MAAASPESRWSRIAALRPADRGSPPRLTLAFAAALVLHLAAALMLPDVRRLLRAAATPASPASAPPAGPATAAAPMGEVIPIRLPLAGFRLQNELGAIPREHSKAPVLPSAAPMPSGKLGISASLGAAAREAAAAYERQHPQVETTRRVAELRLAGDGIRTEPPGAAPKPAAVPKPTPAPEPAPTPPATATAPRIQPPSSPPAPRPKPPAIQQPIRPQIYPPVSTYRAAPPDKVAVAPPLPPADPQDDASSPPLTAGDALVAGAQAAPDRGAGEPAANRGAFFQQLTTHLFTVNQQVLAEAIRATPRLTVEVRFTIDRSGRVLGAQVMRSTGDPALDRKAAEVILRASPVPQLAPDMPQPRIELSFPVQIYR